MLPGQLKETTMNRKTRTLLRVQLLTEDRADTASSVERLMGTKAESRFAFISERAEFASEEMLDV
jgi:topoisomerase-4 subunit B